MKLRGRVDEVTRRLIRGWAINMEDPETPLRLRVRANGADVAQVIADKSRPALRESLGHGVSGNHGFLHTFVPSLPSFVPLTIEVFEARTGRPLPNLVRPLPGLEPGPVPLRPLLVSATGRSGTTLLMSELVRHPRIVVANRFPFEIKLLSYYSACLKVLTADMDRQNSTNPDNIFDHVGQYRVGFNPFNGPPFYNIISDTSAMAHLFEHRIPQVLARDFRQFIEEYYELVRRDQEKSDAMYFAEKVDLDEAARAGPRVLFGDVREIALVRDPRDFFCSARAFWKLDSQATLEMIKTTIPRLQSIALTQSSEIIAIRYEDLVTRPQETKARLYRFLGLRDDDASETLGDATLFARHGTSRNADASIGRWKEDLTPAEANMITNTFAGLMEAFGYQR